MNDISEFVTIHDATLTTPARRMAKRFKKRHEVALSATKGNASVVGATEASSVKNPEINQGFNMSNHTEVTTSRAITVPFHGAELYVVEHNGEPYTPMKPIVEGVGVSWQGQHEKLTANNERWGIKEILMPSKGGVQSMLSLPLRKLAGWLMTLSPNKIKNLDVRARVIQYQDECDDALWQYWNDGVAVNHRAFSVQPDQTLSEEQAATLRNLLTGSVKKLPQPKQAAAMIQGWSKLKAHFKANYRQIPAHEFHEAVNILARHVAEWEVVDDEPSRNTSLDDAVRLQHAFTVASQTAAKVQQAVFSGVMAGNEDWKHSRYLVNLGVAGRDGDIAVQAKQVASNACVLPINRFHDAIEDSMSVDAQTLTQLASVCMARLGQMAQRAVPTAAKAIGATA